MNADSVAVEVEAVTPGEASVEGTVAALAQDEAPATITT